MPYIKLPITTQTALATLLLPIIALLPSAITAQYYSKTNENNFLQLQSHLSPGVEDVLENLNRYSKLYVSAKTVNNDGSRGNCVWSECGLDDQTDEWVLVLYFLCILVLCVMLFWTCLYLFNDLRWYKLLLALSGFDPFFSSLKLHWIWHTFFFELLSNHIFLFDTANTWEIIAMETKNGTNTVLNPFGECINDAILSLSYDLKTSYYLQIWY